MKKKILGLITLCMMLNTGGPIFSWEPYDRVIAVVNSISIIESEINNKFDQVIKFKKIPRHRYSFEKSRILDRFIEDALVFEAASGEAIVISDERVLTHLENILKQYLSTKVRTSEKVDKLAPKLIKRMELRLKDDSLAADKKLDKWIDDFIRYIETSQRIGFRDFFEELRSQIRKEQVMSIAIGVSPPSKEDAVKWYNSNKRLLGDEVWVKHILIRPKGNSITYEAEANNALSALRDRVIKGESFEAVARKYSQDYSTAAKGGDLEWKMLAEMDPYFAGYVNRLRRVGEISQVFKSSYGYHIVKFLGRRPVSFEKVENLIMYKLYNENLQVQFEKWVMRRKKESEIQIFMENYVKA